METIECNICGLLFPSMKSMTNHRRWHDLPQYEEFQKKQRKVVSKIHKGKKTSEETKKKMSESKKEKYKNEKNSNWKGDDVSYKSLHEWVRNHKPKPELCEWCGKVPPYDLANISGEYKRDVNDYEYLCNLCHKKFDGNWEKFVKAGINTRFKKGENRLYS